MAEIEWEHKSHVATHKLVKTTIKACTDKKQKKVDQLILNYLTVEYSLPKSGYDIKQFDAIPVKIILVVPSPPKTARDNQG